jgi:hypothetical protein
MSAPQQVDLVDVVERIVEYIHLTSQHRDGRQRVRFFECPQDRCVTWRQFLANRLP